MKQWSGWPGALMLLLCGIAFRSSAQQWQAELPVVEKAGLHVVVLSSEMIGRSLTGAGDVRLMDDSGAEVPYVFGEAKASTEEVGWEPFKILRNEAIGRQTFFELEKPAGEPFVEEIRLSIRNADVRKRMRITGSDDRAQWFFVTDDLLYTTPSLARGGRTQQTVLIPPSDYSFLRIALDDSLTDPVQITGAEWRQSRSLAGTWTEVTEARWTMSDSGGMSRLRVTCPYEATIDRVEFLVDDTGRYFRACAVEQLVEVSSGRGAKRRTVVQANRLESFRITSESPTIAEWPGSKLDTFSILIDNGNDQPLRIADLKLKQLRRYLLAELQPGKRYRITTGDRDKSAPRYDMVHFKDKLPEPVATVEHGPLLALTSGARAKAPAIALQRWWIWCGLGAILLIVGVMAWRMLRENR